MKLFGNKSKLRIAPPDGLPEPDEKIYEFLFLNFAQKALAYFGSSEEKVVYFRRMAKFTDAMETLILDNFSSISMYMEREVFQNNSERKAILVQKTRDNLQFANTCAWWAGYKLASDNYLMGMRLGKKDSLEIDDIPSDAFGILCNSIYIPYYGFAIFLTDYYQSEYGRRTRGQAKAHLQDTYQALITGGLGCLLQGIQSYY